MDGRTFACYPRWGDDVRFTVAELRDGEEIPYPSADMNLGGEASPEDHLVSVQSVVVDPRGGLWMLDTGSIEMQPVIPVARSSSASTWRATRQASRSSPTRAPSPATRWVIVVDLRSCRSWRRLTGHATVRPELDHVAIIDGQPLDELLMGSDGIAISADGHRLFYCPLASRRLYSVSIDALADTSLDDDAVATTIVDHGQKGASDGLETDAQDRLYATNYEHGAVIRTSDRGQTWEPVAHQPEMHFVGDLREPPYLLMRVPIGAGPLREN